MAPWIVLPLALLLSAGQAWSTDTGPAETQDASRQASGDGGSGKGGSNQGGKKKKEEKPAPPPDSGWPAAQQVWVVPSTLPAKPTLKDLRAGGPLGLGPMLGSRAGLSLKVWPTLHHGLVIDVGGTPFVNTLSFGFGYQGHSAPLRSDRGVAAQFTFGVGFRTRLAFTTDVTVDPAVTQTTPLLGLRVPFGVSVTVAGLPLEIWAEAGPALDLWQAFGVDVEGVGGIRLYVGDGLKPG